MRFTRRWKIISALCVAAIILAATLVWCIGGMLVLPANQPIENPPPDLHAENVTFPSASGAIIHGWFVAGEPGHGAVLLLHGVHANRMVMASRAEFLSRAGYAVLLFDFQAHGESLGKQITFGFLESRDATAAVDFLRQKLPGEKIGVIGVSMGAVAALLAQPPLPVSALVLESCYPTIYQATEDRIVERFGFLGCLTTPLLTCQLEPRLGISPDELKPIESARNISIPKFFIAGSADKLTTEQESKNLFAAAAGPKQFWLLDGAAHQDLRAFAGAEYDHRVLAFLTDNLK
jgi:pimeloyl-ACP methyl ester carboxylesterase